MARALRNLEVMDAATGHATVRRLLTMEGGEGAYAASTALPSAEGRRGNPKAQALTGSRVHPLPPGDRDQLPCSGPNRDTETAVLLCLILASGHQGPALPQKAPLCAAPSPCPWGSEWPEPASGWLAGPATRNGGAGSGTGTSQTCTGGGAG